MVKHRVFVKINEQNQFWIVVDIDKFIRYPTKEELKGTSLRSYSDTNICPICKKENSITDKSILYPGNACHGLNENNEDTDDWICINHRRRDHERYDLNSRNNIIKSMADCRLDKVTYSPKILGEKSEKLTEAWTGAKKLSEKYDKYNLSLDHDPIAKHLPVMMRDKLIDLYGNVVQTKAATFNSLTEKWDQDFKIEHDKEFDILILYCLSGRKMIERIYIFPRLEVIKRSHITVYKNPTTRRYVEQWYENYRIKDNKILEEVNKIWCEISGTIFVYEEFIKVIHDNNKKSDGGYAKEDIIDMIMQFVKENNRYPRAFDWIHNPKYPNFWKVTKIFGSWSIAIGEAKKYCLIKR